MQVSWIDPDEVSALLAQIEGPRKPSGPNPAAWEVHTLPVAPPVTTEAVNLLAADVPSAKGTEPVQEAEHAPAPELGDNRAGPGNGELWRIRERLRALREKAEESGILPKNEAPPPAVEESPVVDEQPAMAPTMQPPPPPVEEIAPEPALETATEAEIDVEASAPSPAPEPEEPVASPIAEVIEAPAPPPPVLEPAAPPAPPADFEPLFASAIPDFAPAEESMVESAPVEMPAATVTAVSEEAPVVAETPATPEPAPPPFVVPALGLGERLAAFAEWACVRLDTRDILLVDDYGDVLWGGQAQSALVLSALMAWQSAQHSAAVPATDVPTRIDREMSGGRALTILSAHTRYGTVNCAAIRGEPVTEADAQALLDALGRAVEGVQR